MTLADRLGQLKFWWNVGKEYADIVKGTLTPMLVAGYWATQSGHNPVLVSLAIPASLVVIGIGTGAAIVRWRVFAGTVQSEWRANPYMSTQIRVLEQIERNTREWLKPASSLRGS